MSGKSGLCPSLAHTPLGVSAKAFVHFAGRCGRLLIRSVRHAYDTHQEKTQMRFAPTEPRSWRDVQHVRTGCYWG
jgi:hypothetical protein